MKADHTNPQKNYKNAIKIKLLDVFSYVNCIFAFLFPLFKKNPKPTNVDMGNKVVTYMVYKHDFESEPFGSLILLSLHVAIFS